MHNYFTKQQKSTPTVKSNVLLPKGEIIMQKIHPKSQTSMLYQQPTETNTVQYKKSGLVIPSLIVIAICLGGVVNCAGFQSSIGKVGVKQ